MADRGRVLVLGGAGYIGSHTCKALDKAGLLPVVVDNLSHGHEQAVQWGPLEVLDVGDTDALVEVIKEYKPEALIHFAAFIEVAESVKRPSHFYRNNVGGVLSILEAMARTDLKSIVFSSTAAVYGQPDSQLPLRENMPLSPINPYGNTKLAAERMIRDHEASAGIRSVCLRYFNACGADEEGRIGEMHYPESHLIPLVLQTALGLRKNLSIFGTDYDTRDGTCIRDYVHVDDLADAHVRAVLHLIEGGKTLACNLGTGNGYSVREIVDTARRITGKNLDVLECARRPGDPAFLVADNGLARKELGWEPKASLERIVETAYKWHASSKYIGFWNEKTSSKPSAVTAICSKEPS